MLALCESDQLTNNIMKMKRKSSPATEKKQKEEKCIPYMYTKAQQKSTYKALLEKRRPWCLSNYNGTILLIYANTCDKNKSNGEI